MVQYISYINMAQAADVDPVYDMQMTRYQLISQALSIALEDEEEEEVARTWLNKRSHREWMSPWLPARTDPSQCNTFCKLEADFIRLGAPGAFRKTTRMPPTVYQELLEIIRPLITYKKTPFREPVSAEERLSLTIRYLTRGDSVSSLAQGYRVGDSTVLPIVQDTCRAIFKVLHEDYLKAPTTEQGWKDIAQGYHDRWNMPHVLGSLDGKHVRITRPRNSGSYYYNYKGFYSIVLFAMVDYDYKFVYVEVGAEGRASDSTLWKYSCFNKDVDHPRNPLNIPPPTPFPGFKGDLPYFFVGDDAFEMSTHLMKPYPAASLSLPQRIYNYRISRCRRIVENAFGILSTRFRIFRKEIEMEPDNAQCVVMACIVLHNFLREKAAASYIPKEATDWEDRDYSQHRGLWRGEENLVGGAPSATRNHPTKVKEMRNNIADWCLTKEGELRYQYDVVLRHDFFFEE